MQKKDKKDDEGSANSYANLDKTAVLQESRYFNETPLNPRKCIAILTKIMYIVSRGDKLSRTEATEAFFAITKLFQHKDLNLRRMVYLVIKEMSTISDDVMIVTSSLQKDVNDKDQQMRAPALRALCKIIDHGMVQILERHIREGIVNKNSSYACAAIVSSYHLMQGPCPELIRGCANEVQEAANSDKQLVQYHALGLLYEIRRYGSSGSVVQMLQRYIKMHLKSPWAHCLLIRMVLRYLVQQQPHQDPARETELLEFLDQSLRHRSDMVLYEAARAIVNLRSPQPQRLTTAINVLQVFCSSPKAVLRYAAVRTLNNVAMKMSGSTPVSFNSDLEALITDSNRSIATLAITTLLKVGSEHNVDRLIKQISSFMSDISDEFKVVVVESIKNLASKYPKKYASMLNFLSSLLRDNDGYKFKKVVVMTIESIIKEIPDAKSAGLLQLCEFIEDCEHMKLTQRILYLIGQEGPHLPNARKFIRYIYNRIMLEDAPIRCTATIALAKFGAQIPELLPSVMVLLSRITLDEDDEVRDRARLLQHLLVQESSHLNSSYILSEMNVSSSALERQLRQYYKCGRQTMQPFNLKQVPAAATDVVPASGSHAGQSSDADFGKADMVSASSNGTGVGGSVQANLDLENQNPALVSARLREKYIEELAQIHELDKLGPLFKSSSIIRLVEDDLNITCVKHVFEKHIVLQFNCINTMRQVRMEDVKVEVLSADGLEDVGLIGCPKLEFEVVGKLYQVLEFPELRCCMASVDSRLLYNNCELTKEGDLSVSYEDDFPLDPLSIGISDSVIKIMKSNFEAAWNELGDDSQRSETFSFRSVNSIEELVHRLEDLGLHACEGTGAVEHGRSAHTLLLAGKYRSGNEVLINCKIVKVPAGAGGGLSLQFMARCAEPDITAVFFDALEG